ncbi:Secretion protein HlyD family protein [Candidatus Zixiibacteriota bacterium]|nr:Secretion protein HlyD family protein [candidate division Zixibacteria bacterium]
MDDSKMPPEANNNNVPKKKFYSRKRFLIPTFIFLLLAGVVVGYWYLFLKGYVGTDDAYIDGDPVTISPKILGRITMLAADEGDTVASGEVLVNLDDSDLKAQEAELGANLELTRKNLPVAGINLDKAKDDFSRASMQFNSNVITKEQFDHARKALELAEAQYAVARSQITASEARLAVIETQLKNTKIISPTLGVVAKKWSVVGDIVQPGQPIFTLYDLKNIWITANFEETKIGVIAPGTPVEISVDSYPDRKFTGKVLLIGAATASQFSLIPPDNASGNFTKVTQRIPVKISIEQPANDAPASLLPGMSVVVKIREKEN